MPPSAATLLADDSPTVVPKAVKLWQIFPAPSAVQTKPSTVPIAVSRRGSSLAEDVGAVFLHLVMSYFIPTLFVFVILCWEYFSVGINVFELQILQEYTARTAVVTTILPNLQSHRRFCSLGYGLASHGVGGGLSLNLARCTEGRATQTTATRADIYTLT